MRASSEAKVEEISRLPKAPRLAPSRSAFATGGVIPAKSQYWKPSRADRGKDVPAEEMVGTLFRELPGQPTFQTVTVFPNLKLN